MNGDQSECKQEKGSECVYTTRENVPVYGVRTPTSRYINADVHEPTRQKKGT